MNDYNNYTKEELIAEIGRLNSEREYYKKRWKYCLDSWESLLEIYRKSYEFNMKSTIIMVAGAISSTISACAYYFVFSIFGN